MRNKTVMIAAVCCVLLPQLSIASDPDGMDLTRINGEVDILKAKLEREKLRQALLEASGQNRRDAPDEKRTEVTVKWVEGFGSDRWAMLVMPSGNAVEARTGDRLPDGSIVAEIGTNRVTINRSGRAVPLEFLNRSTPTSATSQMTQSLPMGMAPMPN